MNDFEMRIARIALTEYALNLRTTLPDAAEQQRNGLDMASMLVMDVANALNERLEQALIDAKGPQPVRNSFRDTTKMVNA